MFTLAGMGEDSRMHHEFSITKTVPPTKKKCLKQSQKIAREQKIELRLKLNVITINDDNNTLRTDVEPKQKKNGTTNGRTDNRATTQQQNIGNNMKSDTAGAA